MNYIVLDMEWNQPSPGEKLIYRNNLCISNEIIQIGAVKLDDSCTVTDTFSINIRPSIFRKLNKNVSKLTGIDASQLENAVGIAVAIEKFRNWCGDSFVFITWGYDDIGVLGSNLKYFSIDTSWLPECYNLQMVFCSQTDNENRQYSLSYAAEYFKIETDKPLHNALTDAYYTAMVCGKLDIKKGINTYRAMVFKDKSIPEHMKNIIFKRNYPAVPGYANIFKATRAEKPVCYKCGSILELSHCANNGIFNRLVIGRCPVHGEYAYTYKFNKIDDDTYNASEQCFYVDRYNRDFFLAKVKKMRASNEKRKRISKKKHENNNVRRSAATASISDTFLKKTLFKQPT